MDTLQTPIFIDQTSELVCLQQSPPCVDLTDTTLPLSSIQPLLANPSFSVTSAVSLHRYYDVQFLLANNFWGCNFNFGNNVTGSFPDCGSQIRQGIAHLIDKNSFVSNEPNIAGLATALDNPLPPNNGGLPSPNPCAWDSAFSESGTNCAVGSPGGTAYHLAPAAGVNFPWQPALGSLDFCAAAQHFINAGLATGKDATTCVLTGIASGVTAHTVNFFIRNDDSARLELGQSMAQEICALFGQGFVAPCSPYLTDTIGPLTNFPGFDVCGCNCMTICLNWGIYTGGFNNVYPFDQSLYFTYNSRFVVGFPSIQPPNGPCSSAGVANFNTNNYMYLCNPAYDAISTRMEFAPCLSAVGDPATGSKNNGSGADCPGTSQLSAISAGVQTEDAYGKGAFSIPVYDINGQFGYLSNWQRVINGDGVGIPNYFTWLDAYSPNSAVTETIRQGFSQNTRSLNPYSAATTHDLYIVKNIYDSLSVLNPLDNTQIIHWMTISERQLNNTLLSYVPPPGTISTFRYTLRSDLFFQDGRRVTSFDVAFTYLSLLANGAFQGSFLSSISGMTLLGPTQFDVNVKSVGPFSPIYLTSPTVLPGRYWSNVGGGAWDSAIASCSTMGASCYPAQYTLGPPPSTGPSPVVCNSAYSCSFPAANLNADPGKLAASYDPIANGILVGSGPWACLGGTGVLGSGCSSSGMQNPPVGGYYTLTRFGRGVPPGSSLTNAYFRSNGNLALYVWSGDNGDFTHDFVNFASVAHCYGQPAQPLGSTGTCPRFQQGIGANGGPIPVGIVQISIVLRFVGVRWVDPYTWQTSPPTGIAPFPPVLYEGGVTLNPASVAGCGSAYPAGGYDC